MKTVLVSVRLADNTYVARAGQGKDAKTASCTSCGPFAAKRAASKYLNVPEDQITMAKHAPGVFRAEVVDPAPTSP